MCVLVVILNYYKVDYTALITTHWRADIDEEHNKATKYLTHDNGGRPYLVSIYESSDDNVVRVSERSELPTTNQDWTYIKEKKIGWDVPVLEVSHVSKVFAGINKQEGFTGNSVLVHLAADRYLYVGECIFGFSIKDPIIEFYSPVGNNDVPYPFAVTSSGKYVMMTCTLDWHTRDIISNIPGLDDEDPLCVYRNSDKGSVEKLPVKHIKK